MNTSAGGAFRTPTGDAAYAVAGVLGLRKSAAIEYAGQQLRVNPLMPGSVDITMMRTHVGDDERTRAAIQSRIRVGRTGTADEFAAAAVWRCSEQASLVNGLSMIVDGGQRC